MLYKCPKCNYLTEYITHMDRHLANKHGIIKTPAKSDAGANTNIDASANTSSAIPKTDFVKKKQTKKVPKQKVVNEEKPKQDEKHEKLEKDEKLEKLEKLEKVEEPKEPKQLSLEERQEIAHYRERRIMILKDFIAKAQRERLMHRIKVERLVYPQLFSSYNEQHNQNEISDDSSDETPDEPPNKRPNITLTEEMIAFARELFEIDIVQIPYTVLPSENDEIPPNVLEIANGAPIYKVLNPNLRIKKYIDKIKILEDEQMKDKLDGIEVICNCTECVQEQENKLREETQDGETRDGETREEDVNDNYMFPPDFIKNFPNLYDQIYQSLFDANKNNMTPENAASMAENIAKTTEEAIKNAYKMVMNKSNTTQTTTTRTHSMNDNESNEPIDPVDPVDPIDPIEPVTRENPLQCYMCNKIFANETNRQRHEKDKCPKKPRTKPSNTTNKNTVTTITTQNPPKIITNTSTYVTLNGTSPIVAKGIVKLIEVINNSVNTPLHISIFKDFNINESFKGASNLDIRTIMRFYLFLLNYFEEYTE